MAYASSSGTPPKWRIPVPEIISTGHRLGHRRGLSVWPRSGLDIAEAGTDQGRQYRRGPSWQYYDMRHQVDVLRLDCIGAVLLDAALRHLPPYALAQHFTAAASCVTLRLALSPHGWMLPDQKS
eukprot:1099215-Rhodomonas_salina.3